MKMIKINKSQLEMGVEVEKEHKDIFDHLSSLLGEDMPWTLEEFCGKVAKAHLKEFSDYYTLLTKMENQAKSKKKK